MKKFISVILILAVSLICLSSCASYGRGDEVYTTYGGVYITVDSIETGDSGAVINAVWHNESENYISFGLWYTVEYLDGEEWKNVQITDFAIPEIACTLESGREGEQSYSLKYFNTIRPGTYRLRVEFYIPELELGTQMAYATFEVSYK